MPRKVLLENEADPTEFVRESDLPPGTLVKDKDGDVWWKVSDNRGAWWLYVSKYGYGPDRDETRERLNHLHSPYTVLSFGADDTHPYRQWEDE